jgi:hypothetical protein
VSFEFVSFLRITMKSLRGFGFFISVAFFVTALCSENCRAQAAIEIVTCTAQQVGNQDKIVLKANHNGGTVVISDTLKIVYRTECDYISAIVQTPAGPLVVPWGMWDVQTASIPRQDGADIYAGGQPVLGHPFIVALAGEYNFRIQVMKFTSVRVGPEHPWELIDVQQVAEALVQTTRVPPAGGGGGGGVGD